MSQSLVIPSAFDTPNALAALDPTWNTTQPEFASGVRRGFAVVSLRGKVWRIVHQGAERPIMRAGTNPPEPAASVDVVLVRANLGLSKVWYQGGYQEGQQDAPDCFSNDGVRPDRSVTTPQCASCAACPKNVWGSKVTEQGKPTKECSDSKRIAILPVAAPEILDLDSRLDTLENEMFGGAMLLRVPAASMADLAAYEGMMFQRQHRLHGIVTRLSFDHTVAYPKIVFTPIRPLTPDEFGIVMDSRESAQVLEIIGGAVSGEEAAQPATGTLQAAARQVQAGTGYAAPPPVQPTQQAQQAQPAPVQQAQPAPAQPAPVQQAPVQQPAPAAAPAAPSRRRGRPPAAAQPTQEAALAAQQAAAPAQAQPAQPAQPAQQAQPAQTSNNLDDILDSILT